MDYEICIMPIVATFMGSFVFSLMVALFVEAKRRPKWEKYIREKAIKEYIESIKP
jgi:hypothetical protein